MLNDFVVRALLAGLALAVLAGPVGSFVVWRRMAYFGETLAHASLLGVAFAFLFDIGVYAGVLGFSAIAVLVVAALESHARFLPGDSLLGVLATGALAAGVIVTTLIPSVSFDLLGFLFGDVLSVSVEDLIWLYAGGFLALIVLGFLWRDLLALSVHPDLAAVEGRATRRINLCFLLLLAAVVASAIKVVGLLLVVALLIVPAAAARPWARSPERMAAGAALIGMVAVTMGIAGSLRWDLPAGPAMAASCLVLFAVSLLAMRMAGTRQGA